MKDRSDKALKEKAARIKWLFADVDGTLTDGKVYYGHDGEVLKSFSMRDGTGFFLLREVGIGAGLITGENSAIVKSRAEKLKLAHCLLGVSNKVSRLEEFLESNSLSWDEIAYIGDDLNDVKALSSAGLGFAVGDACQLAKEAADIVCSKPGGGGAFREAVEYLLSLRGVDINTIVESKL